MTHHTDAELLPCPFCGSRARRSKGGAWHGTGCAGAHGCPAYLSALTYRTQEEADEAWNRRAPAVPVPQSIEQMAVDRYKVVPSHSSMFYPCAVVAGDGQQQLYIGREAECQNMARKFTGAFLDGAFVALAAAPQPPEAAPVELPEPSGCLVCADGESHHWDANRECAELFVDREKRFGAPYMFTFENLYTEQQVRQLLANHGIQERST